MKKVYGIILAFLLCIVNITDISAATIKSSNLIIDGKTCYKNYHNDVTNKDIHGNLPSIFITVDGKAAYCVNFGADLIEGEATYQEHYLKMLNNNKDLYNKISLIGLYGYAYSGHKTNNYYGAAQLLIWEEILGAGLQPEYKVRDLSFYSSGAGYHAGELINLEVQKKEILKLVEDYYKKPSFCGQTYKIKKGQSLTIKDSNSVLGDYKVSANNTNYLTYQVSGNQITFKANKVGAGTVLTFSKGINDTNTMVYRVNDGQEVIIPTDYPDISCQLKVEVLEEDAGYIQIKKVDKETKEPLEGVKFSVYNEKDEVVDTVITDDKGIAISKKLPYGKYYIKEVESLDGYILNEERIDVTIDKNKTFEIEFTNEKDIPESPPTGDILIGVVWAIGVFCLGFSIYYYTRMRKKES